MTALFCDHPDSSQAFKYLQQIDPQPWIFSTSSPARMSALGLTDCIYSKLKPINLPLELFGLGSRNVLFHRDDVVLQEFLWNSLSKRDILKPYSHLNVRHNSGLSLHRIQNATVISTPLSIAVLDEDNNLVSNCSHNAPEALLKWYLSNMQSVASVQIDNAIMVNVQQSFNLGHWFIDSLSRLFAVQKLINISDYSILVDSCKNDLSRSSLSYFKPKGIIETLPFSVFRATELIVPVISDFSTRCLLAHDYISNLLNFYKPSNNHLLELCNSTKSLKLYLSRQNVSRRKFSNGDEVNKFLFNSGYVAISPEKYSFFDIAHLMNHVSSIIGGNGAAMCNMIASPTSQLSVGVIYPDSHLDDYYFRVSQSLGHSFSGILSQAHSGYQSLEQSIHNYYYPRIFDDYHVSLDRLDFLVKSLGSFS